MSEDLSFNATLDLKREEKTYRGSFGAGYYFSESAADQEAKVEKAKNEAFADYKHDFLFTESSFFLFATARYDYNEFQAYEHRPAASLGFGYDFIKTDAMRLTGEIGAGAAYSFGEIDEVAPEGVFGLSYEWVPLEGHKFSADVTYYPDFSDNPNFRILANAGYSVALVGIEGLAFKLGIKDEYNYEVPEFDTGIAGEKNSLKYYVNLTYDF